MASCENTLTLGDDRSQQETKSEIDFYCASFVVLWGNCLDLIRLNMTIFPTNQSYPNPYFSVWTPDRTVEPFLIWLSLPRR